jgi:hypothetical protein
MSAILPWADLLTTAPHLGLTPPQFWALSVREWRALVGEGQGLDPSTLSDLCAAFPDDEATMKEEHPCPKLTIT